MPFLKSKEATAPSPSNPLFALKGLPSPQKGFRALLWLNRRLPGRESWALTGGHRVPGGGGGWNAPLTDVYFCAQLGRDGSSPAGVCGSECPTQALVHHKAAWVSGSRPPRGWGMDSGCRRFHPCSGAHLGVQGGRGAPVPSDKDLGQILAWRGAEDRPAHLRPPAVRGPVAP